MQSDVEPLLTVIVPAYRAETKLGPCLASLSAVDLPVGDLEVIFVDDASPDATAEIIEAACSSRETWHLVRRQRNSGSPSAPRNDGLQMARGRYVCFFDADDELLPGALEAHLDRAVATSADLVRGPLDVQRGSGRRKTVNVIAERDRGSSTPELVVGIISKTSTTVPGLIRRTLLTENSIRWDPSLRLGEDTVFLVDVLRRCDRIEWCEVPLFLYRNSVGEVRSSTQVYGARELRNHLEVWSRASASLAEIDVDYWALRGQVALQAAFFGLIRHGDGSITTAEFDALAAFVAERRAQTEKFSFAPRFREILQTVVDRDWDAFCSVTRHRLLVAGTDLKFIEGALDSLGAHFEIRIDRWTGHDSHDEGQSSRGLAWADTILAEWLLGNAVWYSKRRAPWQRLVVRAIVSSRPVHLVTRSMLRESTG